MTSFDAAVGIIGAGPVGLTCANRLAQFGISCLVLEAEPELRQQGSKACLIQGDVVEILDKFGCGEEIAAEGIAWHVERTYVRGRVISTRRHPRPLGFAAFVNISQYRIEQTLVARLQVRPQAAIRWSHRVMGVTQDSDGVTVEAATPTGAVSARVRYVVACDGVRSAVRQITGATWTGYTHADRFLITDIRADLPLAHERHFHYDAPFNPGRELVMHAQPGGVWRIDWQLAPDADVDAEQANGGLDRRIRAVIGHIPYEVLWMSTYRFHQRVVDQFRMGRVFFAGDAAHALPPYGARGMNSGIQDADNLAWKLALVLNGWAADSLLDTYHIERHAAALENLRVTEATIRFMVPPSAAHRIARALLLRASLPIKALRSRVNSGTMAEPYVYTRSPVVQSPPQSPLCGRFAPDALVEVGGRGTRLRRVFGERFVLLYSADDGQDAQHFAARVSPALGELPVDIAVIVGRDDPAGRTVAARVIHELDLGLRSNYVVGLWYLVRPDGHIAAAGAGWDPGTLRSVVARCTGCDGDADNPVRPEPEPQPTGRLST